MPSIDFSEENFTRFMALVNPVFPTDDVLRRLLDLARAPSFDSIIASRPQARLPEPPTPLGSASAGTPSISPRPRTTSLKRQFLVRAPRGESLDRFVYYKTILILLSETRGEDEVSSMKDRVYARLKGQFTAVDLEGLPKNKREPRWWNHSRFAREWLVKQGLLEGDSPHGIWQLSTRGREMARRLSRNFNDPSFPQ